MIIAQGAEAILKKEGNKIIKERISKKYRLSGLDNQLRSFRTRREAKILEKLSILNFPSPKLYSMCDKSMKIEMEFIPGKLLRSQLDNNPVLWGEHIGKLVGILHSKNIIHDDLTTANMIVNKKNLFLIDFGLSFFSLKEEDKAVDLHLLKNTLNARHSLVYKDCWNAIIKSYAKHFDKADIVLKRLEKVELRGRNKSK